jgi:nucleobase transporter 1/2
MQYLKNFQTRQVPILERFALLITTTVIWAYAHLLTASGAYKHRPDVTQHSCRTDRANLISSAPWLVPIAFFWLNICDIVEHFHIIMHQSKKNNFDS